MIFIVGMFQIMVATAMANNPQENNEVALKIWIVGCAILDIVALVFHLYFYNYLGDKK